MPLDRYKVKLRPEAQTDLAEIRNFIAAESSLRKADNYIRRLAKEYKSLSVAPHRGTKLNDKRPGMRSVGFEYRITIFVQRFKGK